MICILYQFCLLVQQHHRAVSGLAVWQVRTDSTEKPPEGQANRHAPGCSVCQVSSFLVLCLYFLLSVLENSSSKVFSSIVKNNL